MRRIRRFIAALPFALLSGLITSPAAAQVVGSASLSVEQPDGVGCPDAGSLRATIERHLGHPGFVADAPRQIIVRFLPPRGRRRAAQIVVREPGAPPAERDLSQPGPDCVRLADAVALAVELVVDPDAALRPATPPVAPAPACPEVACPTCAACPAPPPAPAPAPVVRVVERPAPAYPVWARLTGGTSAGLTPIPGLTGGFAVNVGLTPHWSVELGALFTPPSTTDDGLASVGRTIARGGGCYDTLTTVRFGGCAGAMAGAEHLNALSLQPVDPGDHFWAGLWVGGHVEWPFLSRFSAGFHVRGVVPLLSYAVRVEGHEIATYEPQPIAVEAEFSLGIRLR